tara:strand:- start:419 stop:766 length:348 start_codon:yes stop_codon:yes gene_type:complete
MKQRIRTVLFLFFINSIAYASFPIKDGRLLNKASSKSLQMAKASDPEPDLLTWVFAGLLLTAMAVGLYFIFKAWLNAYRDGVTWVRILTYISAGLLVLLLLGAAILVGTGYGYGN